MQSHTTLEVLVLGMEDLYDAIGDNKPLVLSNLPKLIKVANNCQKKLEIYEKYYKVPGEDEDDYPLPDDEQYLPDENVSSDEDNDND